MEEEKKNSSFIKKVLVYFIGSLSSKLMNFILVPLYAYFVLASDLGDYDYIVTIANVVMPIVYFAVWETILKFIIQKSEEDYSKKVISISMTLYFVMTIVSFLVCFTLYSIFSNLNFLIVFLLSTISGATSIWQFSARAFGFNKLYVVAGMIGSVTLLGLDLAFIFLYKLDYYALCITYSISQLVIVFIIELRVKLFRRVSAKLFDKAVLKMMLSFSIPLVINNISLWLYTGGGKLIIKNYLGSYENGLYSFATKFSILISLVSSVISLAVIEEAYSYKTIDEYKTNISKLITIISKAYFAVTLLAIPAIKILYSLAFKNTEYYSSSEYVFWLLLAALFTALSNNYGSAFQVTNRTKYIFITTIIGAVIALLMSLILVRVIGVKGVLIGGAFGPFIMMVARALYAKKATGLTIKWLNNILLFLFALAINQLLLYVDKIYYLFLIFGLVFLVVCCFYRNELKIIYNKIFRREET